MGVWDRPDVEASIAAHLAFWADEVIRHLVEHRFQLSTITP